MGRVCHTSVWAGVPRPRGENKRAPHPASHEQPRPPVQSAGGGGRRGGQDVPGAAIFPGQLQQTLQVHGGRWDAARGGRGSGRGPATSRGLEWAGGRGFCRLWVLPRARKELSETLVFDVHVSRGGGVGGWFPVKFSQSELSRERKAKCDGRKWGRVGEKMSSCCVSLGNCELKPPAFLAVTGKSLRQADSTENLVRYHLGLLFYLSRELQTAVEGTEGCLTWPQGAWLRYGDACPGEHLDTVRGWWAVWFLSIDCLKTTYS